MRASITFGFVCAAALIAHDGAAQKPKANKPESSVKAAKVDVSAAAKKLESGDQAAVGAALDELRTAGPGAAAAAPAVASALGRGLTLQLTQSAIDTLADLESEAGSAVLAKYAMHRDPKIRAAAVKALSRTKGAAAAPALRRALSDPSPAVRGTAASALGSMKDKDAVGDLLVALDHRVNEAAASIGALCAPAACAKLAEKIGKLPFDVVTGGLDQVLFRKDIGEDEKIKVVNRIRELGTVDANKYLRDVQGRWPGGGEKRVRQAIDQAVVATAGSTR